MKPASVAGQKFIHYLVLDFVFHSLRDPLAHLYQTVGTLFLVLRAEDKV
jgi:hypothetical protein